MGEIISKLYAKGLTFVRHHRTLVSYGIIGICGVAIDVLLFAVFVSVFRWDPVVATVVSTSCAISNNFVLNAWLNFKKRDHIWWRFISFYGVGASGVVASSLALLTFNGIFAFDATLVKLVSIPPIVLGQYFLNKHVSFGDRLPSWHTVAAWASLHRWLLLANGCFAAITITLAVLIPYVPHTVGAPDEYQHYGKNVQFMLEQHRLPVSGKDDIDSLSTCRDNQYGKVPCLYSYQFHPGFNYVVSAIFSKAFGAVGIDGITGARLASVAWGLLFINMIYLTGRLFLGRRSAVLLLVSTGFIPQVLFVSSYVSQDIHSLAIGALLVYSSLAYLALRRNRVRWVFYAAFGLLFVAKYNYFILALLPAALLVYRWWQDRRVRPIMRELAWMAGAALVLAGFWYVRNTLLYHDPLGQRFVLEEMTKYHTLGHAWSLLDPQAYVNLFHFDFFAVLFRSFFAVFGYMSVYIGDSYYMLLQVSLLAGVSVLAYCASRLARWWLVGVGLFVALALAQVVFNTFTYDFQAQGRYMFVILPVVAAGAAAVVADIRRRQPAVARGVLLAGFITMAVVLWQSALVLGKVFATS